MPTNPTERSGLGFIAESLGPKKQWIIYWCHSGLTCPEWVLTANTVQDLSPRFVLQRDLFRLTFRVVYAVSILRI